MAKILQIIPSLHQINGGVERGTLDIAKTVIDHGYNSAIISSGGDMAEKYKYKGVSETPRGSIRYFVCSARYSHVSSTESGFIERLSIPCSKSQRAKSG